MTHLRTHDLPLFLQHALAVDRLPADHSDPFDRMSLAQAQVEGLTLIWADDVFHRYPVPVLWD